MLIFLTLSKVTALYLNASYYQSQGFYAYFHYQAEEIFPITRQFFHFDHGNTETWFEHIFYSYNPLFKAKFKHFEIPADKTERSHFALYDAGNIYYTCNSTSNQTLVEQGFYDYREDCYLYPKKSFHIFN